MEQARQNTPSGLRARLSLIWQATRRALALSLRGDVLSEGKYAAFISYRHMEPDRRWAVWLHGALESFVIPHGLRDSPDHRRIGRIFRDEEELAASPHLSADIKDALDRSDWLIVVCSPRAAESEWVSAEIQHFRELKRDNRILALLIEGEPAGSFPRSLYEIRTSVSAKAVLDQDEPLAADVRPSPEVSPRTARRWAKLRLLATILGCRFDDLRRREQERQFRRLALVTATAIAVAVVVSSLAIAAFREKTLADRKTVEAVRNESAALTALANIEAAKRPVNAAKLAVAAWPRDSADTRPKLPETLDALGQAVPNLRERRLIKNASSAAFSPEGTRIVTVSDDNTARVWDAVTGKTVAVLGGHEGEVRSAAFSPDGSRILSVSDNAAFVWDAATGKPTVVLTGHQEPVRSAAFSPDGSRIVTASNDQTSQSLGRRERNGDRDPERPRERGGLRRLQPRRIARRYGVF